MKARIEIDATEEGLSVYVVEVERTVDPGTIQDTSMLWIKVKDLLLDEEVAVYVQMGEVIYNLSPIPNNSRKFTDAEKHMLVGLLLAALAMVEEDPDAYERVGPSNEQFGVDEEACDAWIESVTNRPNDYYDIRAHQAWHAALAWVRGDDES